MSISLEELSARAAEIDCVAAAEQLVAWLVENVESYIDNHQDEFHINFFAKDSDGLVELEKLERLFDELELSKTDVPEVDIGALANIPQADKEVVKHMQGLLEKTQAGQELSEAEQNEIKKFLYGDGINLGELGLDEEAEAAVSEEAEKLTVLYDVVDKIRARLDDKSVTRDLFKKMIFYYELEGIRKFEDGRNKPISKTLDGFVRITEFLYEAYDLPVTIRRKKPRVDEDGDFELDENGDIIIDEEPPQTVVVPASFVLDLEIEFWPKKIQASLF